MRAATGGIAGGWRSAATEDLNSAGTEGRRAAAARREAPDAEATTAPSRAAIGRSRGGVSASSGASRDGSGDFWNCAVGLMRLGCVSTGTGGGIGDGVATGVFVDEDDGSVGSVGDDGGAIVRLLVLP